VAAFSDEQLLERQRSSQHAYYRLIANGHPESFLATPRPAVQATVVPVSPDRSLPNAVLYTDPEAVLEAYDELADIYDRAGVRAWTVWARPSDDDLVAALERRGHAIDGTPAIMGCGLDEIDLEPRVELDLEPEPRWLTLGELNDSAYGVPPGSLSTPLAGIPPGDYTLLVARLDGAPVACAVFETVGGDCEAGFVATLPAARGRGLCGELMREGLRRAREAGAQSTTLEGSPMGEPVYARLGYRSLGRMRMMERRAAAS
jgi:GNAT superfamily N-acetyltransferase